MSHRAYRVLACIPMLLLTACNQPSSSTKNTVVTHKNTVVTHKSYSMLTIDSVYTKGSNIVVRGSTDLPDGANVDVDFDLANTQKYYGSSQTVQVQNGHYQASITPHNWKELQKGPYVITVDFFANSENQSKGILKLVGQNGERLTGRLAKKEYGEKELEARKVVNLKLNIHPIKSRVSAAYLKSYLSFMNQYYQWMKLQMAGVPDPTDWSSYVSEHNREGWNVYHKISYRYSPEEDPKVYQARSDTAQAWVFLTSLYQDYNERIDGTGNSENTKEDERQYLQFYKRASKEVQNLQ